MKVGILVNIKHSRILGPIPDAVYNGFLRQFTYFQDPEPPIYLFYGRPHEAGFYSGLLDQVVEGLETNGIEVEILDQRLTPGLDRKAIDWRLGAAQTALKSRTGKTLRPYQLDAVKKLLVTPHGVCQMGTGAGKTLVFATTIDVLDRKTVVVVARRELMHQIADEIAQVVDPDKIGKVGDGIWEPNQVTVGIIDTIAQRREFLNDIEYVVYDECHMSAAPRNRQVMLGCEAFIRHGFTATYMRSMWNELNLLYSVSGPRTAKVTTSQLIEDGYLARPHITMLDCAWAAETGYTGDLPREQMIRMHIVNNTQRNEWGCRYARMHYDEGRRILMFVSRVKHGRILQDMLIEKFGIDRTRVVFAHGTSGKLHRQGALKGIEDGSIPIVICTSQIFELGINLPSVEVAVNFTGRYTEIGARQLLGRIVRKQGDLDQCWLLDFFDRSPPQLKAYAKHRRKVYESEPAFVVDVATPAEVFANAA